MVGTIGLVDVVTHSISSIGATCRGRGEASRVRPIVGFLSQVSLFSLEYNYPATEARHRSTCPSLSFKGCVLSLGHI
jgi:hypothetical protein